MAGLTPALYTRCREILLRCHEFDDDRALRTVFDVDTLYPFRAALPGAKSPAERVAATLDYLLDKFTAAGRPALPLFLAALRDRYDPGDALYADLEALAQDVAFALSAPGSAAPPIDPVALAAYLDVVSKQCRQMETRPYRQLSELRGAPPSLTLLGDDVCPGVYVPLRFDLHASGRVRQDGRAQGRQKAARKDDFAPDERAIEMPDRDAPEVDVDLARVLAVPGHIVFLGQAGSGKTTVLRLIAAVLATQDPGILQAQLGLAPESWPSPATSHPLTLSPAHPVAPSLPLPIPIFVALCEFEYACETRPRHYARTVEGFLRFLDDHFQRWHPGQVPQGFLADLVKSGRAWLLLDALDEVADFDHRIVVRQVIETLADTFPGNRLLVTARVAAYEQANTRLDARFNLATVRDLTRAQWAPLVEQLYAGLEPDAGAAAERTRRLLKRIDDSPLLQTLVRTPLMVWTATLIHYADRELPEQRAELYNAYVDVLLGERLHEEAGAEAAHHLRDMRWSLDDRRLYLTYAAYQAHERAAGTRAEDESRALVVVDETDLTRAILGPYFAQYLGLDERKARREAADFVSFMAERSGLLHAHPEGYSFGDHLTVQEFLAATYLLENHRGKGREWLDFLRERVGQSWWREVFLLLAGLLVQKPEQARRFLLDELGRLPGDGDAPAYGLAWAGRALLEIPPARVGWHANVRETLAKSLVQVLWRNPPTTSVAARIEVGEVLGRLGDPRFSGDLRLPEFIALPGGEFWMGTDEAEAARLKQKTGEDYFVDETLRHRVHVDAFALAQVPTTNAMFARFIEAGGYREARWWMDAPKNFWRPDGTIKDWWGDERNRPAYWDDAHLNGPNQPVVGVTWYEAAAYCRWLTATLNDGHVYRLPTEAEWERAARGLGEAARTYAWGNDWQPNRANTAELGLERTTPVGIFPDGATPEGLLDMTGNVWEWCSDWYAERLYGKRAGRVVRNPAGPERGRYRVLRGGSWYQEKVSARCAFRGRYLPDVRNGHLGFRVARGSL